MHTGISNAESIMRCRVPPSNACRRATGLLPPAIVDMYHSAFYLAKKQSTRTPISVGQPLGSNHCDECRSAGYSILVPKSPNTRCHRLPSPAFAFSESSSGFLIPYSRTQQENGPFFTSPIFLSPLSFTCDASESESSAGKSCPRRRLALIPCSATFRLRSSRLPHNLAICLWRLAVPWGSARRLCHVSKL